MQINLLWTGIEFPSMENCLADFNAEGAEITGTILGCRQDRIYKVDYRILVNERWQTTLLEISSQHRDGNHLIRLEGDGSGRWRINGHGATELGGCLDVDIPLTPFTNTLPVKRLALSPGESGEVLVVYCDLLADVIMPVRQKYTCISEGRYKYENVPNDFEAVLDLDGDGLVVRYPGLFQRTAVAHTHFS